MMTWEKKSRILINKYKKYTNNTNNTNTQIMYTKYKEKLIFIFVLLTVVLKVETIYNTMLSYCLKCRKNTENKNLRVLKTKNGRTMLLSNCAVYNSKKSKSFWKTISQRAAKFDS